MQKISLPLAISLMIVTGVIGLAGGYYISPSYQQSMYVKDDMGLGLADKQLDLRYINKMAAHHTGAILLANQMVGKSERPEIQNLVAEIQKGEPKLIAELYQWKKEWYNDSREAPKPVVANLGSADDKIDLRFLNALIAHHEEGVRMAKEAKTKSSRNDVLNNADAVEKFLTDSAVMLKGWREAWYSIK